MGVSHLTSLLRERRLFAPMAHTDDEPTLPGLLLDGLALAYHVYSTCGTCPVAGGEYAAFKAEPSHTSSD